MSVIDDVVECRRLSLKEQDKDFQDFLDYLRFTGGELLPDCPYWTLLSISKATMDFDRLPPTTVNLGCNSFTAKAFDFDFSSNPNQTVMTQSGHAEAIIAEHYREVIQTGVTSHYVSSIYTTNHGIRRSVDYAKITTPVKVHGTPLIAALMLQKSAFVHQPYLLH